MKTANLIKKTLIILILLFTVISCKNFMNSGDFLTSLEENIKIINAPKFNVLFEMDDNNYGNMNYLGYKECYISQVIELCFSENQSYKLDHWYFSNPDLIDVETNEDDISKIKITFKENVQDLVIKPICVLKNDSIAPVFTSFIVKQPQSKPIVNGNEDRLIKLDDFSKWSEIDYENNHVNSLIFNFIINEQGINTTDNLTVNIKETIIRDTNGNELEEVTTNSFELTRKNNVKNKRYPNIFTYNDDIDDNSVIQVYKFASIYDGLLKIDVSCSDSSGNESPVKSFYVIKDTVIDIPNIEVKNYYGAHYFDNYTTEYSFPRNQQDFEKFYKLSTSVFINKNGFVDQWFKNCSSNIDISSLDFYISKKSLKTYENFNNAFIKIDSKNYYYTDNNFNECTKKDNWEYLGITLKDYNRDNTSILFHYVDTAGNEIDKIMNLPCSSQITSVKYESENSFSVNRTPVNSLIFTDANTSYNFYCGYLIKPNNDKTFFYYSIEELSEGQKELFTLSENTEYHLFYYDYNFVSSRSSILSNEFIISSNDIKKSNGEKPAKQKKLLQSIQNNELGNDIFVYLDTSHTLKENDNIILNMYYTKNLQYYSMDQIHQLPYVTQKHEYHYVSGGQSKKFTFPCDFFEDTNYKIYIEVYIQGKENTVEIEERTVTNKIVQLDNVILKYHDDLKYYSFEYTPINLPGYLTANDHFDGSTLTFNTSNYTWEQNNKYERFEKYGLYYAKDSSAIDNSNILKTAPLYSYHTTNKFSCNVHNLTDCGNYVLIASDCPVFVHTIYSNRNFKNDIGSWEIKTSENHKVNPKQLGTNLNTFFMQDYNIDTSIMDADPMYDHYYYVVVAHFSDGKSLMSEVKYK